MSLTDEELATVRRIGRTLTEGVLRKAAAEGRIVFVESGMRGPAAVTAESAPLNNVAGFHGRTDDELLSRADVQRIAGVGRSKSFEIWAALDKIHLGGRCVRVRRADLERFFLEARRRAWR